MHEKVSYSVLKNLLFNSWFESCFPGVKSVFIIWAVVSAEKNLIPRAIQDTKIINLMALSQKIYYGEETSGSLWAPEANFMAENLRLLRI